MNRLNFAVAALLLAAPAALHAQADVPLPQSAIDAGVAPGAIVYDLDGNTVGRILRVTGSNVVVDTGSNQATLAANGFAYGPSGPIIGTSKAQLDSAVETVKRENEAKLGTALVVGAAAFSQDRVLVGTVKEFDVSGNVVLDRVGGAITLPRNQFTTSTDGSLMVRFTNAQFNAALAQQAPTMLPPPPVVPAG